MSAVDKSSDHAGQGDGNLKLLKQEDVCKKHCKSLPLHSCDWLHHRLPTPADNVRSVVHERCLAVTSLHLELLKPHNKYLTINSDQFKWSIQMHSDAVDVSVSGMG